MNSNGKKRCCGGKSLKASEHYPMGYGATLGLFVDELESKIEREGMGTYATNDGKPPLNEE